MIAGRARAARPARSRAAGTITGKQPARPASGAPAVPDNTVDGIIMKQKAMATACMLLVSTALFAGYYEQGRRFYSKKNYEKAKEMFLKAAESGGPGNAYYFLGEIERTRANYLEAEKYYRTAITKNDFAPVPDQLLLERPAHGGAAERLRERRLDLPLHVDQDRRRGGAAENRVPSSTSFSGATTTRPWTNTTRASDLKKSGKADGGHGEVPGAPWASTAPFSPPSSSSA